MARALAVAAAAPRASRAPGRGGVLALVLACLPLVASAWTCALATHFARGLIGLHGAPARWLPFAAAACAACSLASLACIARSGRPGAPACARALLASAMLGTLAWALWVPFRALEAQLGLGLAVGLAGPWMLVLALAGGRPLVRALDFGLFQLGLVALLLELALAFAAGRGGSALLAQPGEQALSALAHARLRPGTVHLGFPVDERGAYDRPLAPSAERARRGERLVVVVGDSFSHGVVPLPFHYTKRAEEALEGVRVYNLGAPGVSPVEYELLVREALALEPELVVVAFFVGNDLGHEARADASVLERWLDGERRYLLSVPRRLLALRRERARREGPGPAAAPQGGGARLLPDDRVALADEMPWLADPRLEEGTFSAEAFAALERDRARSWAAGEEELFAATERQLERLRRACGEVPLALLVIPDEAQVEEALWQEVRAGLPEGAERERAQRRLGAWAEEEGLAFEDLLPRFLALEPAADGSRHLYHLRDTHWNARGNELAGEGLAALVRRALPPRTPTR